MMVDVEELADAMAGIAEKYVNWAQQIAEDSAGCILMAQDAGQVEGNIDALLMAASDIMDKIDDLGVESIVVDHVFDVMADLKVDYAFQATYDPREANAVYFYNQDRGGRFFEAMHTLDPDDGEEED